MLKVQAKHSGSVAVLSLQGLIVTGETNILRDAVHSLTEAKAIKLDLARITIIDAGGLGLLLELRERLEAKGIRFELVNITKRISRVFEITRLNTVFRISSAVDFFPAISPSQRMPLALAPCA